MKAKIIKHNEEKGIFIPTPTNDILEAYCDSFGIEPTYKYLNNGIREIDA